MEIKTFNEILTGICDTFDELISPKTIARNNTNIIYLMFKAIAKGFEVINNVCVVLSNKFNPESCSVEDLSSVASLVGTERLKGSASGLHILAINNDVVALTLNVGTYTYKLDDDNIFTFDVVNPITIDVGSYQTIIAMSTKVGKYPVTAQASITVESTSIIPEKLAFSCMDNSNLLGTEDETDIEFRKRILEDTTRQDTLSELQTKLRNLPYLFDAKVYFNNTFEDILFDGITIPSSYMAIFYSGEPKNEIAEIVASKGIYPTVATDDSTELHYINDVFASGEYNVNIIPFKKMQYKVKVNYKLNPIFNSSEVAEDTMRTALFNTVNTLVHKDYIKESYIYDIVSALNISGVDILNVDLLIGDNEVDYVNVPLSRIPELTEVIFEEV